MRPNSVPTLQAHEIEVTKVTHDAAEWVSLFPEDEVPFVLASILRCGATLTRRQDGDNENILSNRLRRSLARDPEFRNSGIIVDREVEVFDDDSDVEAPIGRLDFRFLSSAAARDRLWYFAVEAKRLHVSSGSRWDSLVPAYVTGYQGMMCFIDDRYARGLSSGGMLGYVFDGDIIKARRLVSECVAKNADKLTIGPVCELKTSSIIKEDTRVSETSHALLRGPFVIYHVFLAV